MRIIVAALLLAPAAFGQFRLFQLDGKGEHQVAGAADLGAVYPSEPLTARFRIRNTSDATAALTTLAVRGDGFSLTGTLPLPLTLSPQQGVDFAVAFRSAAVASYSAFVQLDDVSVLLTASVLPRLSGGGPIDFGSVVVGYPATREVTLT